MRRVRARVPARVRVPAPVRGCVRALPACLLLLIACGEPAASAGPDAALTTDVAADAAETPPVPAAPDCNPIVGSDCLSGVPSDFYSKPEPTTATGRRVDVPASVVPAAAHGTPTSPVEWNRRDGFSPAGPIVVLLPRRVDPKGLADETKAAQSVSLQAATVLLDAETGKPLPHLAELDANAPADSARQALILRPWTVLPTGRRIVVALTTFLRDEQGQPFARTEAFQRLADGELTGYPRIDAEIDTWRQDLALLEKANVPRDHVIAAWHYTTASPAWTTGPVLAMREQLLQQVGAKGLKYELDQIEVDPDFLPSFAQLDPTTDKRVVVAEMHQDIALRVRGRFETPLFLTGAEQDATLSWQGQGPQVKPNGTTMREFVLLVPPSVVAKGGQAPLLLYGHGLLRGACVEGCIGPKDAEFMPHFVNGLGVVMVGTDWWGLSQKEFGVAIQVSNDFSLLPRLADKLAQAAVQPLALTRVVQGQVLADPLLQITGPGKAVVGPVADAQADLVYYGNSLGGIMGTTMSALHPDLTRMVMNVPGCTWSLMLNRSSNFKAFFEILAVTYPDPYTQQVLFGLSQGLWDLADPVHFARHVVHEPLPGGKPGRRALWPVALHDSQVPNLASGMLARAAQQPLLTPAPLSWFSSAVEATLPYAGKGAFVTWDTHRGTHPPGNALPFPDNGAHLATRWMPEFQQMIWRFLLGDGAVEQRYCLAGGRDKDGQLPCDLEQPLPESAAEMPALVQLPPPVVP